MEEKTAQQKELDQEFELPFVLLVQAEIGRNEDDTIKRLLFWDKKNKDSQKDENRMPIMMFINSEGGYLYGMLAIIDIMKSIQTPVITYCAGIAFSSAAHILLSGDYRCITPNSTVYLHRLLIPSSKEEAQNPSETKEDANHHQRQEKTMINITAKATGKSVKEIRKILSRGEYFSAYKAKRFGIVDKVVNHVPYNIPHDLFEKIWKKKGNSK